MRDLESPAAALAFAPIESYLPHRGTMVLLDRVLEASAGLARCAVSIRRDSAFCRDFGGIAAVPAYVGIEYMAQTIGVLAGWRAQQVGGSVKTGFLVSARKFEANLPYFPIGMALCVEARDNWQDMEGRGVMDCAIFAMAEETRPLVRATLMVFQPHDLDAYLATLPA
jgi:predicted hotdog family 3-hydroxylacyl-ACP dehydratase